MVIGEIADVLADKCLSIDDQRDGVFEIGAQSQNGALARDRGDGAGCIAARAAQYDRSENAGAGD